MQHQGQSLSIVYQIVTVSEILAYGEGTPLPLYLWV